MDGILVMHRLRSPGGPEGFRLRIGGGPRAAGKARAELSRLRSDLDAPLLERVRLLVTELITNAVRHAEVDTVDLVVLVARDRIRIEIANPGGTFETKSPEAGEESESGWGLFLVDRLSDAWGVIDEKTGYQRVWFEVRRA
jgi:anti-sigma regulatory factor (Ser/Thr protein kinase)